MKTFRKILIFICITVFVICGVPVTKKLMEYKKSRDTYNEIRKEAVITPPAMPLKEETKKEEGSIEDLISVDWQVLSGTDAIAWLQAENISYPVLWSDKDSYYSHRLPDKSYNYGGSLYVYAGNKKDLSDRNTIIYGHNMADGSMFGTLKQYLTSDHAEHKFYLYTPDNRRHEYVVFAVVKAEKTDDLYKYGFKNSDSFLIWQKELKDRSNYATGGDPDKRAKFVTLSTCNGYEGTTHRLLVVGKETKVRSLG